MPPQSSIQTVRNSDAVIPGVVPLTTPESISFEDHIAYSINILHIISTFLERHLTHFSQHLNPGDHEVVYDLYMKIGHARQMMKNLSMEFGEDLPIAYDVREHMFEITKIMAPMINENHGPRSLYIVGVMYVKTYTETMIEQFYSVHNRPVSWFDRFVSVVVGRRNRR